MSGISNPQVTFLNTKQDQQGVSENVQNGYRSRIDEKFFLFTIINREE
jgi:hypothetical protein